MSAAYVNTADDVMLADENISRLPPLPPDEIELDAGQQSIYETCDYIEPAPASSNWEVSREFVHIVKDIGKGAFSQVAKAEAWNICGIKGLTTVAVKMLKGMRLHSLSIFYIIITHSPCTTYQQLRYTTYFLPFCQQKMHQPQTGRTCCQNWN